LTASVEVDTVALFPFIDPACKEVVPKFTLTNPW
jgi:hypothetical protein